MAGAAGLTAVALAAAACGSQAPSVALPPKAATATAAPAAPAALSGPAQTPAQAVAGAYQAYWQAYAAAMTSANATQARVILAPYTVPAGVARLIGTLKLVWAAHDTAYGGAVTHVKGVEITGRRAILHDCLDLSHFGVTDQLTGRVMPDSFGRPNQDYYVTLLLSGGRWLVSNMQPVEVPCTP
ncbi:MAG TPA: hypothetical protein VMV07_01385 [Streptosporangiaceae bacterium]|nr:hypothetical protein [Streptosporangiaceae bacterium]